MGSEPDQSSVTFEPLRPASGRQLVVGMVLGPILWLVALHVGIAYAMRVGFFSAMMLTFYLAFVPPERAEAVLRSIGHRSIDESGRLSSRTG